MLAFYPRNLSDTLVIRIQGIPIAVPLREGGWAARFPYMGHPESLTLVGPREAEVQLRTAGWTGADFMPCPCGEFVPAGTLAPVPGADTAAPHCASCQQAARESL